MNHPPKLQKAINGLIINHPFYASVLLRQQIVEDNSRKTFSVNGKTLKYNSAFLEILDHDEIVGVLAHEVEHLARFHHTREKNRDHELWNKATDMAINPLLIQEGFKLPKGAPIDSSFPIGECAENIYRVLKQREQEEGNKNDPNSKQNNQSSGNQSQLGKGNQSNPQGQPNPNAQSNNSQGNNSNCGFGEVESCDGDNAESEEETEVYVKQAIQQARQRGKLPAHLERLFTEIPPRVDWKEVLARFLNERAFNDYSFAKPNRRFIGGKFVLPSLYSKTFGKLIMIRDTSGSIGQREADSFLAETKSILNVYEMNGQAPQMTIIDCDAAIHQIVEYEGQDSIPLKGGGGTDFNPPFKHINESGENPICIIYLTDGYGPIDKSNMPDCPVIWCLICHNPSFTDSVPFGEVLYIGD